MLRKQLITNIHHSINGTIWSGVVRITNSVCVWLCLFFVCLLVVCLNTMLNLLNHAHLVAVKLDKGVNPKKIMGNAFKPLRPPGHTREVVHSNF